MRKRLIIAVTFAGGVYFFLKFFLPESYGGGWLDARQPLVSRFNILIGTVAIGLGVINIFRIYGSKVLLKDKTRFESLVLLVSFSITFVVGMLMLFGPKEGRLSKEFFEKVFDSYIVDAVFEPLGAAMFSLLGFYITRAAFRAFRLRNVEAALVMLSALLIMLGALPVPLWEAVLPEALGEVRGWLLAGVNTGVQRAILVGSGLAWLLMAVRMWLSLDEVRQGRPGSAG